jgi:hypothetical protein
MSAGKTANILWHVNLLANDHEISDYTTAVANSMFPQQENTAIMEVVFSMW